MPGFAAVPAFAVWTRRAWGFLCLLTVAPNAASAGDAFAPSPQREQRLVRMVRQDCGSCHGLQLTGGLGPALTPAALRDWSADNLAATILHGRPGTPMPPWSTFVSADEAGWIARRLLEGFPQEGTVSR
jgi:cytochrome c55X